MKPLNYNHTVTNADGTHTRLCDVSGGGSSGGGGDLPIIKHGRIKMSNEGTWTNDTEWKGGFYTGYDSTNKDNRRVFLTLDANGFQLGNFRLYENDDESVSDYVTVYAKFDTAPPSTTLFLYWLTIE